MALDMLRRPWAFDVLPTENMFGDILSDLGAGLVGGMGFSPSADIGDDHAVVLEARRLDLDRRGGTRRVEAPRRGRIYTTAPETVRDALADNAVDV